MRDLRHGLLFAQRDFGRKFSRYQLDNMDTEWKLGTASILPATRMPFANDGFAQGIMQMDIYAAREMA